VLERSIALATGMTLYFSLIILLPPYGLWGGIASPFC
jgi:hypothetical protein